MEEKLLSVIVPIYNVEQYLPECVDSILNQTYKNIEIILVDDGATDQSGLICDAYRKKDSRIKVIHKQNEGLLAARLTGVNNASGGYITFVDSDDWIDKDMYHDLMHISSETNADIVMSGIYRYVSEEDVFEELPHLKEGLYNTLQIQEYVWPVMLWSSKCDGWEVDPSLCTKIFKKEEIARQLQEVRDLNVYYGEDTVTLFPLLLKVNSIYISKHSYYYHRQKGGGEVASYIKSSGFIDKTYIVYKYLEQAFQKNGVLPFFEKQLNFFFMNSVQLKKKCYLDIVEKKENVFPFFEIPEGNKIILYGAGDVGKRLMNQNEKYHFVEIVMWVDRNYQVLSNEFDVCAPDKINDIDYDNLLIAVQSASLANEIRDELIEQGVDKEKIIWVGIQTQTIRR